MNDQRAQLAALSRRAAGANVVRLEVPEEAGLVPPHDLGAEAAVLSAISLDKDGLSRVRDWLRPEHFRSEPNEWIYRAALALDDAGVAIDIVSLASWLRDNDRLAFVGGPSYLAQLSDATPAVNHVEDHARIVRDKFRLRELIDTCMLLRVRAYTGDYDSPQGMLDAGAEALDGIATNGTPTAEESLGGAIDGALDELEAAADDERPLGMPTGLYELDRLFGGLVPGAVTIIGARTSMGKTSLARHIALAVASSLETGTSERGETITYARGVQFFQMEGKRREMALDWAHTIGRVDMQAVRLRGHYDLEERQHLRWAQGQIGRLPVWIDDTPGQSAEGMRAKARLRKHECIKKKVKLRLVIVDHLQLMEPSRMRKGASREEVVAANSRALKKLAMELDVHVIALSQLNRSVEDRSVKDKRPRLADLRESGSIENDAHNVLLLYRPEYYDPNTDRPGICEAIVEKQRGGSRQVTVEVGFDARFTRFYDAGRGP